MSVVGLDVSLKALGICIVSGDPRKKLGAGLEAESTHIRAGEDLVGPERLAVVTDAAMSWLRARGALGPGQVFVQEGYAFASQAAHSLGEIGGCVRRELWHAGGNLIVVPPSTLKKYVTGRGVNDKNVVMKAAFKRWAFDSDDDNECDAFCAAMLGLAGTLAPSFWTSVESEVLLRKVERYAGKNQTSWLGGAAPGKVAGRTKRRASRRAGLRSAVLVENV